MNLNERLNTIMGRGPEKWLSRSLHEQETDREDEIISHEMMSGVLRKKRGLKPNVGQELQRAVDDVVAPLPRQGAKAKARAKNLGMQVTGGENPKVMEPQFDMDVEDDRGTAPTPKRPNLNLDLNLDSIRARQDSRRQAAQEIPDVPMVRAEGTPDNIGTVNQSKYVDGGGRGARYRTGRGGGESKYLNENSILELLYEGLENGVQPTSEEASRIASEGHMQIGASGTRRNKVRSAMLSAQRILEHLDELNPGEYLYSKKGGQNTNIPDERRSTIGDDIFQMYVDAMGKLYGERPADSASARRGRGETAADIAARDKQNRQQVQNFLFGGGETANLEDAFQTADIYLVREAIQQELMDKLQEHAANYGTSLFGSPTPMDGEMLTNAFLHTMQEYQDRKDFLPISLKEVPKNKQAVLAQHNTTPEDYHEILDIDFDENPSMNLTMGDIPAGEKVGRADARYEDNVIGMMDNRHIGASGMINALNPRSGDDVSIPLKYFSANKRWDGYKVEPTAAASKLGEFNMGAFRGFFDELGLPGLDDNIPAMNITGDRLSDIFDEDSGTWKPQANALLPGIERFNDDHVKHWVDKINNYQETAPENLRFGDDAFQYRGETLEPGRWMESMLRDAMIGDDEATEMMVNRGGGAFHQLESRAYVNSLLRNLNVMDMFREAEAREPKGLNKLLGQIIYGAQNKNSAYHDDETDEITRSLDIPKESGQFYWPRLQISG